MCKIETRVSFCSRKQEGSQYWKEPTERTEGTEGVCHEQTWDRFTSKVSTVIIKHWIKKYPGFLQWKKNEGEKLTCHQLLSLKFVIKVKAFSINFAFLGETTGYPQWIRKISSNLYNKEWLLTHILIKRKENYSTKKKKKKKIPILQTTAQWLIQRSLKDINAITWKAVEEKIFVHLCWNTSLQMTC